MSIQDLDTFNPYPTVVIPMGADGSISHAICVIDDLISDTTQAYALKCTRKSMGWICHCGPQEFVDVYLAIRFDRGFKCKTHIRAMSQNWGGREDNKAVGQRNKAVKVVIDEDNGTGDDDDDDSSSDDYSNRAARKGNQAVKVEINEDSFLTFGAGGAREEDIDPMWQVLRDRQLLGGMAQPIVEKQLARQLARLAVKPLTWENDPIQLGLRCKECGERPCLWLEHREEMMDIHHEYYNHLPIDDQPPNIIHRIRMYNEFVRYMNRRGIGEQLRARLPKCIVDYNEVHETYPG